jgi:solute carrier family 25 (mitochondrial adenine nucleotide translocator), member 4/5/6/31
MAAAPATPDKRKEEDRLMRSPASVAADFAMGGAAAVVAKTGAAPVERVKLLLQNQGEMLRRGTLTHPYKGIAHAFARVLREEGAAALWRGNQANVIRYFPTQVFPSPLQIAIAQGKLLVNLIPTSNQMECSQN